MQSREEAIREALAHVAPEIHSDCEAAIATKDSVYLELLLGIPARWPGGRPVEAEDFAFACARRAFKARREGGHST